MLFKVKQEFTIQIDQVGNAHVTDQKVEIQKSDSTVQSILQLKESQMKYNYIAIGKYAEIQMPKGINISAIYGVIRVSTHTHNSQTNRIDRLALILKNFSVGDNIQLTWSAANNQLEFHKL